MIRRLTSSLLLGGLGLFQADTSGRLLNVGIGQFAKLAAFFLEDERQEVDEEARALSELAMKQQWRPMEIQNLRKRQR